MQIIGGSAELGVLAVGQPLCVPASQKKKKKNQTTGITCVINHFSPLALIEMYVFVSRLPAAEGAGWIFLSCCIALIYGQRFSEDTLVPSESTSFNLLSSLWYLHTQKWIRKQRNGVAEGFISLPDNVRLHQVVWRLKTNSQDTLI